MLVHIYLVDSSCGHMRPDLDLLLGHPRYLSIQSRARCPCYVGRMSLISNSTFRYPLYSLIDGWTARSMVMPASSWSHHSAWLKAMQRRKVLFCLMRSWRWLFFLPTRRGGPAISTAWQKRVGRGLPVP